MPRLTYVYVICVFMHVNKIRKKKHKSNFSNGYVLNFMKCIEIN